MKKLFIFPIMSLFLLFGLVGCNGPHTGKDSFPEFLVGVWEGRDGKHTWGMKFEPDGSISKIIHAVGGQMVVSEGGYLREGPEKGTFSMFALGPCEAKYHAKKRWLTVKLTIDKFHMKLPGGELIGHMEDNFVGAISEDGKTWHTEQRQYTWLEGASPPDKELIDAHPHKVTFKKINLEDLMKNDTSKANPK